MDRNTAHTARVALNKALEESLGDGFEFDVGRGTFDSQEITFKVTLRREGTMSSDEKMAHEMAHLRGYRMENAKGDKLIGYRHRSPKYPWIVRVAETGKEFKYTDRHMLVEGFKLPQDEIV